VNALATKENGTRAAATAPDPEAITRALAEPFAPDEVKWKPAAVSGNRALALCYVDARTIQDRLDEVLGPTGWQDDYELLPDNSVVCRLRLRLGGEWITKVDVGGPSEQPDDGDKMKAAFSDALKRAAVKFGIGRYLYRLPQQWVDYDPQKKRFAKAPQLPEFALPNRPFPAPGKKVEAPPPKETALPRSGEELEQRVKAFEKQLVARKLCKAGELARLVVDFGRECNLGEDVTKWPPEKFADVVELCKKFERGRMATATTKKPA